MQKSTYEFHFHFDPPDEDTQQRINAILAAQQYTRLKITHVEPVVANVTIHRNDGTPCGFQRTAGISDISISGESDEFYVGYDYRLAAEFVPSEKDRGYQAFQENWSRLHMYSSLRQLMQFKFKEGYVYIILYHDGMPDEDDQLLLAEEDDYLF